MNNRILVVAIVMIGYAFAKAQSTPSNLPIEKDTIATPEYFFIDGDSVSSIELSEVMLLPSLKFDSKYENLRYRILKRKVKKVWPYAKLASERLTELERRLATLESKSDRRKYTKMVQRYVEEEFTTELKKLSTTEGQILIKLIHRQTGMTTFELLKKLRSGWSAFWFNNTAKLFSISLKEEYRPETVVEDFYIEDILLNEFTNETLQEQDAVIEFDYIKGRDHWDAYIDALPEDYDKVKMDEVAERRKKYLAKKKKEAAKKRKKLQRKRRRASRR